MRNLLLGKLLTFFVMSVVSATGLNGQTKKILLAGDSIIKGEVGSSPVGGFRDDLDNLLKSFDFDFVGGEVLGSGFDSQHEGHAAWTTDSVDVHIGDWLTSFTPDEVLILVGTNDISLGIPNATIISNLERIVDQINAFPSPIRIYLSALIPRNDGKDVTVTSLNVSIESSVSVMKGQGVNIFFTDPNSAFKANPNWITDYMFNNLHPNNLGYNILAQVYFETITFDPSANLVEVDTFDDPGIFAQDWTAGSEFIVTGGELVNTSSEDDFFLTV